MQKEMQALPFQIVSLRNNSNSEKYIFKQNASNIIHKTVAKNINAYLIDGKDIFIKSRGNAISNLPEINFGSMANDGGNLLLSEEEKDDYYHQIQRPHHISKKLVGALEFIRGVNKFCIWIEDNELQNALTILPLAERVKKPKK